MKNNFEILTLNEGNVNRIYNECLRSDTTIGVETYQLYKSNPNYTATFDSGKIISYIGSIHYLIGQLDAVHQQAKEFNLKSSIVSYDKRPWTKDMKTLIHFYYLGMATNMFSRIDDTTKIIGLTTNLPTLAPIDPNFKQWLKTDGKRWEEKLGQEP